jgi:hypothetical protein
MVLAVECDGATYHSSATARDRDRLRQEHLERLGWSFHRIWSTDWFRHREAEIDRAVTAWKEAVAASDAEAERRLSAPAPAVGPAPVAAPSSAAGPPAAFGRPRSTRPYLAPKGTPVDQHPKRSLVALACWIESDTLLRTEDDLLDEMMDELGYRRRGARIVDALTQAIRTSRSARLSA